MYEGGIKNNAEGGEPGERGGREPLASSPAGLSPFFQMIYPNKRYD